MSLIVIVDVGNFSTKYCYQKGDEIKANSFPSVIHPYKPLEDAKGMKRFKYNDKDYYVGEDVKNFYYGREEEMYFGNTKKGHHEAQIRLVAALYEVYKETGESNFNLVLTCPYESMQEDKKYFMENFFGKRSAIVDDQEFNFEVKSILMAAEGLGAFNSAESMNCVIVDAGSKTLNILYLVNGSVSKEDSFTLNGGTIDNSSFQLANKFAKKCGNVDYSFPIICTGGKGEEMKDSLQRLDYSNVEVAELENLPTYYVNSVGLLLKFKSKFEAAFS